MRVRVRTHSGHTWDFRSLQEAKDSGVLKKDTTLNDYTEIVKDAKGEETYVFE